MCIYFCFNLSFTSMFMILTMLFTSFTLYNYKIPHIALTKVTVSIFYVETYGQNTIFKKKILCKSFSNSGNVFLRSDFYLIIQNVEYR